MHQNMAAKLGAGVVSLGLLSMSGCAPAPMPTEYSTPLTNLDNLITELTREIRKENPDWRHVNVNAGIVRKELEAVVQQIQSRLESKDGLTDQLRASIEENKQRSLDAAQQGLICSRIVKQIRESDPEGDLEKVYSNMKFNMQADSPGALMSGTSLLGILKALEQADSKSK